MKKRCKLSQRIKRKVLSKQILSIILSFCMVPVTLPVVVYGSVDIPCENHKEHDESCGYIKSKESTVCSHRNEDGSYSCAPIEDIEETTPSNAKDPYVCDHTDDCGYAEETIGTDCGHECELCNPAGNDKTDLPEVCTCTTFCTESTINTDCKLCSLENADFSAVCLGEMLMLMSGFTNEVSTATELQTAIDSANSDTTLIMTQDISANIAIKSANIQNITLDLNGHTLSGSSGTALKHGGTGKLTITDSSGGGKITNKSSICIQNYSTGELVIESGTVEATNRATAIHNNATGMITINGGKVTSSTSSGNFPAIWINGNPTSGQCVLQITDGWVEHTGNSSAIYNESKGKISISGGMIVSDLYEKNGTITLAKGGSADIVLEMTGGTVSNISSKGTAIYNDLNGIVAISDGTVTINGKQMAMNKAPDLSSYDPAPMVTVSKNADNSNLTVVTEEELAKNISSYKMLQVEPATDLDVVDTETKLKLAFSNVSDGGTVTLSDNIQVQFPVSTDGEKSFTLDLNGYTLSASANVINHCGTGTLTIDDSSAESDGVLCTLSGKAINCNSSIDGPNGNNGGKGNVTVKNGTVQSGTGYAIYNNNAEGIITVDGGTVTSSAGRAIFNNNKGTIVVNDGTVSATEKAYNAIENSTGSIIIEGGTVSANTGNAINTFGGTVTISDGTVTSGKSSLTSLPGTIYLGSGGVSGETMLEISGGSVDNTGGGPAIYNAGKTIEKPLSYQSGKIVISGGTITSENADESSATLFWALGDSKKPLLELTGGEITNTASTGIVIKRVKTGIVKVLSGDVILSGGGRVMDFAPDLASYPEPLALKVSTNADGTEPADAYNASLIKTYKYLQFGEIFVPVTGISDVTTSGITGIPVTLSGTVEPSTATNQTIVWSLGEGSTAKGAAVSETQASATGAGNVVVRATITNGTAKSTNYTQDFTITFTDPIAESPVFTKDLSATEVLVEADASADFVVEAAVSDGGTVTYAWYSNSVNSTDGATALTNTQASISYDMPDTAGHTVYIYCVATNTKDGATETTTSTIQPIRTKNNAAAIKSFGFTTPTVTGIVNDSANTVTVTVPYGTDVTAITPDIVLTDAKASISPASGTAKDFSNPVTYTVTAEDGKTTKSYIVTVTPNKAYTVAYILKNITAVNQPVIVEKDDTLHAVLTAESGYILPETITVKMGENLLAAGAGYTYDYHTGAVSLMNVTDNIIISAEGISPVTGITLDKTDISLYSNRAPGSETLTASVMPAEATNKAVTWHSSNTAVATVTDGIVTAISKGTATITVTTVDGGKTAACIVTVLDDTKDEDSVTIWTSLPPNYTGSTKVIGNVRVPAYTVEGDWKKAADGSWSFSDKKGTNYKNTWAPIFNPYANPAKGQSAFDWFMFDSNGKLLTGWYKGIDGNTYYFNPSSDNTLGAMKTGWILIDGKHYYFNEVSDGTRGRLFRNTKTPDGYFVDENGVRQGNSNQ